MPTIPIMVHSVPGAMPIDQLDIGAIKHVFASAGITLKMIKGKNLDWDPSTDPRDYWWIRNKLMADPDPPGGPKPGHIFLGTALPDFPRVNGQLIDTRRRGVAVTYTRSRFALRGGPPAVTRITAHEIGHMLNITERSTRQSAAPNAPAYSSTMNQRPNRFGPPQKAWDSMRQEAKRFNPSYLSNISNQDVCYPLSYSARSWLHNNGPIKNRLPWGTRYRGGAEPPEDVSQNFLKMDVLKPHNCHEGGPLVVRISVTNQSENSIRIPHYFGTEFRTVIVKITTPSGLIRQHRPMRLSHLESYRYLAAGSSCFFDEVIIPCDKDFIFEKPGVYSLKIIIPPLKLSSPWQSIHVDSSPDPMLSSKNFQRFLIDGAPPTPKNHIRALDDLLESNQLPKPTAEFLAWLRLRTLSEEQSFQRLLKRLLQQRSILCLRDKAAFLACIRSANETYSVAKQISSLKREGKIRGSFDYNNRVNDLIYILRKVNAL